MDLTKSAEIFGMVTAISQVPVMLFAIPGGIIADRMNKKRLVVILDFSKTLVCFSLFVLFLNNSYSIALLTAFITIFMAIIVIFQPILTAATPSIVNSDAIVEANGAIQSINAVSGLLSFVLGGILVATIDIRTIIFFCGISFLISAIIDLFIKIPFSRQQIKMRFFNSIGQDMKESFHYMRQQNPVIFKSTILFSVLALLFLPILTITLPYIVRIEFQAGDELFGISQAITSFGMLLGGILSGKFKSWLKIEHFFKWIFIMAVLCLVLALSVYTPLFTGSFLIPFWIFNIGLMVIMIIVTFGNIIVMALVQEEAPAHILGKVIALVITIANLSVPIGQYLFGLIIGTLVGQTYILFVLISIITMVIAIIAKKLLSPFVKV